MATKKSDQENQDDNTDRITKAIRDLEKSVIHGLQLLGAKLDAILESVQNIEMSKK